MGVPTALRIRPAASHRCEFWIKLRDFSVSGKDRTAGDGRPDGKEAARCGPTCSWEHSADGVVGKRITPPLRARHLRNCLL